MVIKHSYYIKMLLKIRYPDELMNNQGRNVFYYSIDLKLESYLRTPYKYVKRFY